MKYLLTFTLVVSLLGCVTYQSNIRQSGIPTISRVLVVSKLRHVPANYADEYRRFFPSGYEFCALTLSPVDFEKPETAIKRVISECKPDAILTIELIDSQVLATQEFLNTAVNDYSAEMRTPNDSLPFWKCTLSVGVQRGLANLGNRDYLAPHYVFNRLYRDNVLQRTGRVASVVSVR